MRPRTGGRVTPDNRLNVIIGVVVAAGHNYLEHLDALRPIASAVLAVLLWPLVLFGISLHLK